MLIPIKIGKKKYKIKPIIELTTKEFIELSKMDGMDYVKYISWQTGVKFESVYFALISKSVEQAIGEAPDITKMKLTGNYDYTKYIDRVGLRHQLEACEKTGFELLAYALAVSQAYSLNIDEVEKLYDKYMDEPFKEVLPAGFFFFKRFENGNRKETSILKRLLNLMRTMKLRKQQGVKS